VLFDITFSAESDEVLLHGLARLAPRLSAAKRVKKGTWRCSLQFNARMRYSEFIKWCEEHGCQPPRLTPAMTANLNMSLCVATEGFETWWTWVQEQNDGPEAKALAQVDPETLRWIEGRMQEWMKIQPPKADQGAGEGA